MANTKITSDNLDTNIAIAGTLGVTGVVTADAGVSIDNITIDGTEIDLSSGDLTIDVAGDITLDADGGDINFKDDGTLVGALDLTGGFAIKSSVSDADFFIQGNDGGSAINALILDMSAAGAATFNAGATFGNEVTVNTDTNSSLTIKDGGTNAIQILAASGDELYIGSNNAYKLRLKTDGNIVMDNGGSFGIGTSSPSSQLHIESGNAHNKLSITSTASGGTGYDAVIDLLSSAANSEVAINMGINGDADREQIKTYQSAMTFRTNNTERMRIGSTGKITTRGTTLAGYAGLEFGTININSNVADGVVDFSQGLVFTDNVTNEGAWTHAGICATGSSGYNGNLVFGTDGNSSRTSNVITERMRISANGKVSIGGTEDTYDLMIKRPSAASATSVVLQRVWNQNQGWQAEALTEYFTDLESTAYPRAQIGYYRGDTSDNNSSGFIVKTGLSSSAMATRFKVTATGMVEMPEQPAFMASLSSGQAVTTTNTTIAFSSETFDRKGNHSNGVFTAPHAGVYLFGVNFLVYPWTSGIINVGFYKDGSNYSPIVQSGPAAQSHTAISNQCLIQCNKNDEITVKISGAVNSGVTVYGSQAYWWGYMVG